MTEETDDFTAVIKTQLSPGEEFLACARASIRAHSIPTGIPGKWTTERPDISAAHPAYFVLTSRRLAGWFCTPKDLPKLMAEMALIKIRTLEVIVAPETCLIITLSDGSIIELESGNPESNDHELESLARAFRRLRNTQNPSRSAGSLSKPLENAQHKHPNARAGRQIIIQLLAGVIAAALIFTFVVIRILNAL